MVEATFIYQENMLEKHAYEKLSELGKRLNIMVHWLFQFVLLSNKQVYLVLGFYSSH